jgi:hypothetical protein
VVNSRSPNETREQIMTGELDTEARQELVELNEKFAREEQRGDAAREFFEQHLSDRLIFRRANGNTVGKHGEDGFLEGLKKPNPFESRASEGISVSPRHDRALVTLVIVGTRKDDKSVHRYRNIRLFSRAGDGWLLELWYNYEITGSEVSERR